MCMAPGLLSSTTLGREPGDAFGAEAHLSGVILDELVDQVAMSSVDFASVKTWTVWEQFSFFVLYWLVCCGLLVN